MKNEKESPVEATTPAEKVKKERPVQVNARAYCGAKKYSTMIAVRLETYLRESNDADTEKTMEQWDRIYLKAMNRETK